MVSENGVRDRMRLVLALALVKPLNKLTKYVCLSSVLEIRVIRLSAYVPRTTPRNRTAWKGTIERDGSLAII